MESLTYYDTFDWRLHDAGITLAETAASPDEATSAKQWIVRHPNAAVDRLNTESEPGFAWDLPEGRLREELGPLLDVRKLLPVVHVEATGKTLCVLDEETKTLVRIHLREGKVREPEGEERDLPVTLRVAPLRGYDRERDEVVKYLRKELKLDEAGSDELGAALQAVYRTAGDYSSKMRLHLEADQPAALATAFIHKTLMASILANEDGVRQDIDSEFLHDFRVAVRRTRSALSQVKNVFPAKEVERFKGDFAWLGSITGPCRDLDVYLLKIEDYEASLPEEIRPHLEPLRTFLHAEKQRELRRLVRSLGTQRYKKVLTGWEEFLDSVSVPEEAISEEVAPEVSEEPVPEEPVSEEVVAEAKSEADDELADAGRSIREVSAERIWRAYRRILKKGRAITPETPADPVHRLRIDAKKLRYLLEFFKSLYPEKEIRPLIRSLKSLQDNLGDFNDYEVQRDKLGEFAHKMQKSRSRPSVDTLLAMGELVAGLRQGQAVERRRFHDRFEQFDSPANRAAYEKLFGPAKKPKKAGKAPAKKAPKKQKKKD